jgi:CPA1 family monovalent cation:H+ antiporter
LVHLEISLLVLLAIAAAVATLAARVRMPYAIGLIIAGLALSNITSFSAPPLTKELLFLVVLPGLLFEAAFMLDFGEFWRAKYSILILAVPGLVVSTLATAVLFWLGVNELRPGSVTFDEALAFGALISATDPISVLSLFRSLGVDNKLCMLIEGESLFNDGTAVVLFTLVLGFAAGGDTGWMHVAWEFARVTGLAALVGALIGFGAGVLTRSIDDPTIELTVTLLCAYGTFIVAELLGASGVIACVLAGLVTGTWGARGMSNATRTAVDVFWSYAAFLLNSFIFLLIGTEIHLATLFHYLPEILLAWAAINLSRAAIVYLKYLLMRAGGSREFSLTSATLLTWGGLRGGLSMVLALALPSSLVHRELILHTTYGVVLLTLLVQGLTMKPLVRALGLVRADADARSGT